MDSPTPELLQDISLQCTAPIPVQSFTSRFQTCLHLKSGPEFLKVTSDFGCPLYSTSKGSGLSEGGSSALPVSQVPLRGLKVSTQKPRPSKSSADTQSHPHLLPAPASHCFHHTLATRVGMISHAALITARPIKLRPTETSPT